MPLTPLAPGRRRNNRTYVFRGSVAGRRHEIISDLPPGTPAAELQATARRLEHALWLEYRDPRLPEVKTVSFARAVELYTAWRCPSAQDRASLRRLVGFFGEKPVDRFVPADLIAAANQLYPKGLASSKNRSAIRPAAAVLHYAAHQGWCGWLRTILFKEKAPVSRALSDAEAAALIAAAEPGAPRLLALWLFRQGDRISDALRVQWPAIDLKRATLVQKIGKIDEWVEKPLHPEILALLRAVPPAAREGRLFAAFRDRRRAHSWWVALREAAGVPHATMHMTRHTLGRQLNEQGAGLRTIMRALSHRSVSSSLRYQSADLEVVREAISRIGEPSAASPGVAARSGQIGRQNPVPKRSSG